METRKLTKAELEFRDKTRQAIIGFFGTLLTTLSVKVVTLLLASATATEIIIYLNENLGFWLTAIATGGVGGFFAQWKTQRRA